MEMNGAKKDAERKLHNKLANQVRDRKLSKKEMKQLHSHLTARTKTNPPTREDPTTRSSSG